MVQGTQHYNYVYQFKDHLGNIRMNYAVDPADDVLKIKDENHYYPFGLKHSNYNSEEYAFREFNAGIRLLGKPPVEDPNFFPKDGYDYKYNGKEWQDELNLNLYDYGARNYDPAIGRWMNIDPLAEAYRKWSPYTYCADNPLVFADPDGMSLLNKVLASLPKPQSIDLVEEDAQAFVKSLQDSMDTETWIKNSWDETSILAWFEIEGGGEDGGGGKKGGRPEDGYLSKRVNSKGNAEILSKFNPAPDGPDLAPIARYVNSKFEENTLKWYSHGSTISTGGGMMVDEFSKYLKANSALFKNADKNGSPLIVKLFACQTGQIESVGGLAHDLSKLHPNMIFIAPTTNLLLSKNTMSHDRDNNGNLGYFNVFKNGRIIETRQLKK